MGDRVKEGGPTTTETDKARLGKTVVCTRGNGVLAGMEAQVASEGLAELGGFLGVTLALQRQGGPSRSLVNRQGGAALQAELPSSWDAQCIYFFFQ